MLYLGTMFAPVKDRGGAGKGFTHKLGDIVSISTPSLGTLTKPGAPLDGVRALDLWREPPDAGPCAGGPAVISRNSGMEVR